MLVPQSKITAVATPYSDVKSQDMLLYLLSQMGRRRGFKMKFSKGDNKFGMDTNTPTLSATSRAGSRKVTTRVLTEDEINYVRENTGKIPLQEIAKELHIWSDDLKMLCKGVVEMKKRPNRGAPKYVVPKFTGKSSHVSKGNVKKKPEQVKQRVSKKMFERSIEECFANPIMKVNIETGQILHERDCL